MMVSSQTGLSDGVAVGMIRFSGANTGIQANAVDQLRQRQLWVLQLLLWEILFITRGYCPH